MELKQRNLRVNMKGHDVRALQRTLRRLDFEIDEEVALTSLHLSWSLSFSEVTSC